MSDQDQLHDLTGVPEPRQLAWDIFDVLDCLGVDVDVRSVIAVEFNGADIDYDPNMLFVAIYEPEADGPN